MGSGLDIRAMNIVRKHLTAASGGRLAAACPAPIDVLLLSDVLGDDIGAIGSGPFAPDPSSYADALALVQDLEGMDGARALLECGARGELAETPDHGHPCFSRVRHRLVASHTDLLDAAEQCARRAGFERVERLASSDSDVEVVAARLDAAAEQLERGSLLLSGGEPSVTLSANHGRGGRSQQLALQMARGLDRRGRGAFLAVGSDGSDGPTDAAGAVVDATSWKAMAHTGDPLAALDRADAHPILDAIGALIRTGPTGTNLLDLHLLAG
jgi:glycerate-2-kinase